VGEETTNLEKPFDDHSKILFYKIDTFFLDGLAHLTELHKTKIDHNP